MHSVFKLCNYAILAPFNERGDVFSCGLSAELNESVDLYTDIKTCHGSERTAAAAVPQEFPVSQDVGFLLGVPNVVCRYFARCIMMGRLCDIIA